MTTRTCRFCETPITRRDDMPEWCHEHSYWFRAGCRLAEPDEDTNADEYKLNLAS